MIDLFWLILSPILIAILVYFVPVKAGRILALVIQGGLMIVAVSHLMRVRQSGTQIEIIGGWPESIGIALRAELFSIDLVLTSIILFTFVFLYLWNKPYVERSFLFLFLVFEGLIHGIFLSVDLFNIFVLVEVSTVVISILIMHKKNSTSNYDGIIYLLTNIVAMTFFLFGIGLLYQTTGVIDLLGLKRQTAVMTSPDRLLLPYAFLITGVSLKAALMPLFSWLPKAHGTPAAPSVVSAILSGLYVKCGIYLFYRIQDAFHPLIDTRILFLILGIITAIVGFVLAIAQKDIKLILAYHTVSQIGLIMTGLNLNHAYAEIGALYHIINHAFFKGTLFLTAGLIIDHAGTRRVDKIRGLWRTQPIAATATLMAVLGITGAPLFNGSVSKYWISYGSNSVWIDGALFLINLGTIVSFVKYSQMLWGTPSSQAPVTGLRPGSRLRMVVVFVMGLLCLIGGLFSEPLTRLLFQISMPIEWQQYGQKAIIFIITLIAGYTIYHVVIKRWDFFNKAKGLELSFNGICMTIVGFFVGILIVLTITH